MKSNRFFSQKGFSLIEILVAMVILAIFIAASAPLLSSSYKGIMMSGEKSVDTYISQKELEEMVFSRNPDSDFIIFFDKGYTMEINKNDIEIIENESGNIFHISSRAD